MGQSSRWIRGLVVASVLVLQPAFAVTDDGLTIAQMTVLKSGLRIFVFTEEAVSGCGTLGNQYQFAVGKNELEQRGFDLAFAALTSAAALGKKVDINHDGSSECFARTVTVNY